MTAPIRPETPEELRRRLLRGAAPAESTRRDGVPYQDWQAPMSPLAMLEAIGRGMAENPVETGLSFTPIIGDAMSARDAGLSARDAARALGEGRYGAAAGNAAMAGVNALAAVPVVGIVGDVARTAIKGIRAGKKASVATRPARTLQSLAPGESLTRAQRSAGPIPDIRSMSPEDAMQMARRGEHLRRVGTSNQYVGAPRGVDSPAGLRALRENYDQLVERGMEGGDWYDRAMRSVVEASGYRPNRQRLFAQEAGLWSAQATPDTNLGFMLQGHNAYEFGTPASLARTRAAASRYNAARDAGVDIPLGPKTGQYTNKFDPTSPTSHISTNDIWHFRNLGYSNSDGTPWSAGGTPQMHRFADAESMLAADRANARQLGGRTNWDAASTQAAPWVYAKGLDLHQKFPKSYPTLEDGLAEARKTYLEYFPKHQAFGTYEAVPGAGTGHLEGIVDAPASLREAYSNDPRSSWSFLSDEERAFRETLPEGLRGAGDGRDILYDATGMYVRPTNRATGYFRAAPDAPLETNPSFVARPLVSMEPNKRLGGSVMREGDQRAMDAVEALRAYFDVNNMGGWHKVLPEGRMREATSLRLPMNRQLTEDEVRRLASVTDPHDLSVIDTGEGVTLLRTGDRAPATGADLLKLLRGTRTEPGMADALREAVPDMVGDIERVRTNSNAVMVDENFSPLLRAENAGTGTATAALERYLTDPAIPGLLDKLDADPRIRQAALARFERDAEYAERMGTATRADVQRARQIIATDGLKGLFEAARKGVALPILAIGALGAAKSMPSSAPAGEGPTG